MVGTKLLLLSIFFFFQGIYGYCIVNDLTDGSSFLVFQINSCVTYEKNFRKHMEQREKFCCPYSQRDCSCHLRNHDEARFTIHFYFIDGRRPVAQSIKCTTGGTLTIHGTHEEFFADCTDANGVITEVPIEL